MSNKKLIEKYKELRNTLIINNRKKQLIKNTTSSSTLLNFFSDETATYNDFIDENTKVVVGQSLKSISYFKTGNLDETYNNLFNKIKNTSSNEDLSEEEFIDTLNKVYDTVIDYFGYGDVEARKNYYEYHNNITLESLKGKKIAVCLEDAVLSQNLLKLLGFDSTLKISLVQYENGKYDTHAYNIIKFKDKNFIFDSRFPSQSGPVIYNLDEEEYKTFISSTNEDKKITESNNGITYFNKNIPLKEAKHLK